MIVPAATRKTDVLEKFRTLLYTQEMFLLSGGESGWIPVVDDFPVPGRFQYAVVDSKNNVVGYIEFQIDWYASCARNFAIVSFDKNGLTGLNAARQIKKLLQSFKLHRVEWRMVGGNAIEGKYDKICKKYGGAKHVLKDAIRDKYGAYHDDVIYEIINRDEE